MGFRWGFQWWKVGSGASMLLIGGGITFGVWLGTGRIFIYPAAVAVIGLFTLISGLIGEEGVW